MGLIDADYLKKVGREICKTCILNRSKHCKIDCIVNDVCDLLDSAPTVEERKQGNWILCDDTYFSKCSICGDIWLNEECKNYCPNCGADMRGTDNGKK